MTDKDAISFSRLPRRRALMPIPRAAFWNSMVALVCAGFFGSVSLPAQGQTVLFFDDFPGPLLNPIWQASLPNAPLGGGPNPTETYSGAPGYTFSSLGGDS